MIVLSTQNPRLLFGHEEIFVNHAAQNRSGHLGHAMVQCQDGTLLAFYSNCSGNYGHKPGHAMYGWVEYKRSADGGITWEEPTVLPYSYEMFIDGIYKIGCEKAVVCDDGTIVLFCLRSIGRYFEPYSTPVCLLSHDNGRTWSKPIEVSSERGRIYDALFCDGRIYVLEFCNSTDEGFLCKEKDKYYKLFASDDNENSFYEYSVLPFDTLNHAYGNLLLRADGLLIFYAYNGNDEYHLTGLTSHDRGKTWSAPFKMPVAKIARNPQVGTLNGHYLLHGRSEHGRNFVFYHSADGIHWDEGTIVSTPLDGGLRGGYYSNNLTVRSADGKERMLVQYSEDYALDTGKVNIMHAWVEEQE